MASYYIVENNQQSGPFSYEQLAQRGLDDNTQVWTEGMPNWMPAGQVPELQHLINSAPPQGYSGGYGNGGGYQSNYVPMPDNHKSKAVWSLVLTVISMFCCGNCFGIISLIFSILALVASGRVSSDYMTGNYHGAMNASIDANKWGNWSISLLIIGGLISITCWLLYYFLIFAASMSGY